MDILKEATKELRDRLDLLEHKHANLKTELGKTEREMVEIKNSIASLSRLDQMSDIAETLREVNSAPEGLTDAIREVLRESPMRLSPAEIRVALIGIGYNITQHSNVLASIHTCLKRLTMQGEIAPRNERGKHVYGWNR
jgi:hypothetical protein